MGSRVFFWLFLVSHVSHRLFAQEIAVNYTELFTLPDASIRLDIFIDGKPLDDSMFLEVCDNRHPPTHSPTSLFCGPYDPSHVSLGFTDCAAANGFTSETINKETCLALDCCFDPTFNPTCRNKLPRHHASGHSNDRRRMASQFSLPRCDGLVVASEEGGEEEEDSWMYQVEAYPSYLVFWDILKEGTLPLHIAVTLVSGSSPGENVTVGMDYPLLVCPFGYRFAPSTHSCEAVCGGGDTEAASCFCGGQPFLDHCVSTDSCPANTTYNGTDCLSSTDVCAENHAANSSCLPNRNLCKAHPGFRFNGTLCIPLDHNCDPNYYFDSALCVVHHYTQAPTVDAGNIPSAAPTRQLPCSGADCYCGSNGFSADCPTCSVDTELCPDPISSSDPEAAEGKFEAHGPVCINTDPRCEGFRQLEFAHSQKSINGSYTQQSLYPLGAQNSSCMNDFSGFLRQELTQNTTHCATFSAQIVMVVDLSDNIDRSISNASYDQLINVVEASVGPLDEKQTNLTLIAIHRGSPRVLLLHSKPNGTAVRNLLDNLDCCSGPCVLAEAIHLAKSHIIPQGNAWIWLIMAGEPSTLSSLHQSTYKLETVPTAFEKLKADVPVNIAALGPANARNYIMGRPNGGVSCSVVNFTQVCHSFKSPPFPLVPYDSMFELDESQRLHELMCKNAQELCLGICAAGWEWDEAKEKCMPISHICFQGHQLNLGSCEVELCPDALDLEIVITIDSQRTVLRVEVLALITLTKINISSSSEGLVKVTRIQDAKTVIFHPSPGMEMIPHGDYTFAIAAASNCGLSKAVFPSFTVANRAPVLFASATASGGRVRIHDEANGNEEQISVVSVRTSEAESLEVSLFVNVSEPDGDAWSLDWSFSGLNSAADVEIHESAGRFTAFPRSLGTWNATARVVDSLGLASSRTFIVSVIGYRPPHISLEGSTTALSLGELSVGFLDASKSTDDGQMLSFEWMVQSTNFLPSPVLESPKNATTRLLDLKENHSVLVRVIVTDDDGLTSNATLFIQVTKSTDHMFPVTFDVSSLSGEEVAAGSIVLPHMYDPSTTSFRVAILQVTTGDTLAQDTFTSPSFSIPFAQPQTTTSVVLYAEILQRGKPTLLRAASGVQEIGPRLNYAVAAWNECGSDCGQGKQTRGLLCVQASGSVLPLSACDETLGMFNRPETSRNCFKTQSNCDGSGYKVEPKDDCDCGEDCRSVSCRSFRDGAVVYNCKGAAPAEITPWTKPCFIHSNDTESVWMDEGEQAEDACICHDSFEFKRGLCIHSATKAVMSPELCNDPQTRNTSESCGCSGRSWGILSRWSNCENGKSHRQVHCIDVEPGTRSRTILPDLSCTHLSPKPSSERNCKQSTVVRLGSAWMVSNWSPCSRSSCTMERTVFCRNLSTSADSTACPNSTKPAQVSPCDPHEYCLVNGSRRLDLLDRRAEDCVILQQDGVCCEGERAVLDRNGACCNSGEVDKCGRCGGSGVPDVVGECCDSGSLDAQGQCCQEDTGVVDECGVCGGNGLSCGLEVGLRSSGISEGDTDGMQTSLQIFALETRLQEVLPNSTRVNVYMRSTASPL